jgi:hypothetical protein
MPFRHGNKDFTPDGARAIIRQHVRLAFGRTTPPTKGLTNNMRELVQIDSASEHACGQPSINRWHVLEPVSGRWSWVRVFDCCDQVVFEPVEDAHDEARISKRAA